MSENKIKDDLKEELRNIYCFLKHGKDLTECVPAIYSCYEFNAIMHKFYKEYESIKRSNLYEWKRAVDKWNEKKKRHYSNLYAIGQSDEIAPKRKTFSFKNKKIFLKDILTNKIECFSNYRLVADYINSLDPRYRCKANSIANSISKGCITFSRFLVNTENNFDNYNTSSVINYPILMIDLELNKKEEYPDFKVLLNDLKDRGINLKKDKIIQSIACNKIMLDRYKFEKL